MKKGGLERSRESDGAMALMGVQTQIGFIELDLSHRFIYIAKAKPPPNSPRSSREDEGSSSKIL